MRLDKERVKERGEMCEVTINRGGIVRRNSEHEKERQRLDYKNAMPCRTHLIDCLVTILAQVLQKMHCIFHKCFAVFDHSSRRSEA